MRIRTILAAAAAPAALAAVLLGTAGQASAATNPNANPGNGALVITSKTQAADLNGKTINKNVDIPAGVDAGWLQGVTITGNLSVEGDVMLAWDTIDGNVTVSGPGSFLGLNNGPSHIGRNLTVQNSSGQDQGGPGGRSFGSWPQYYNGSQVSSQVDGNFTFADNTGSLYGAASLNVSGSFTAYDNGPYAHPEHPEWTWITSGVNAAKTSVVPPTYSS